MKIEKVEAIPIAIPLTKTFSGSSYQVASRATIITRIHTAGGLVSEVYKNTTPDIAKKIAAMLK